MSYATSKHFAGGKEIIVYHIFPPVPVRHWDYQAILGEDHDNEDPIYGQGATIEEAIQNLIEIIEDEQ